MRGKGLLFTLGIFLVAGVLVEFSLIHNLLSKSDHAVNRMIELERASSVGTNLADNIRLMFAMYSGLDVVQSQDMFVVSGVLPNDISDYQMRIRHAAIVANNHPLNATITTSPQIVLYSGLGINFTRYSSEEIHMSLPSDIAAIRFTGRINRNVTQCAFVFAPGAVALDVDILGNPGHCAISRTINTSLAHLDLNNDGIDSLSVDDGLLVVSDTYLQPLNYTLSLTVNETRRVTPVRLDAHITTKVLSATKITEVLIT
jgi:hypothetical protein